MQQLLAVRTWWTKSTVQWIEAGLRGETPLTPAVGYRWSETPRLNDDIANRAARQTYRSVRAGLGRWYERLQALVGDLDDRQLLAVGRFDWTGKWPICRWISINTVRQYTTARTLIRRAQKTSR